MLAELTQTFDKSDASYFFPLMAASERRLGRRPRYGALDAAYDAFYVYQYFHEAGGFAAVPLVEKGGLKGRTFSPEGLPLCAAGLPMPLKFTFTDRTTTLFAHERGKYVCPLRHPTLAADAACPVNHERWPKGGCTAMMPTARRTPPLPTRPGKPRVQGDLQAAHRRRTHQQPGPGPRHRAPHLRRQSAIVNQNTLIYVPDQLCAPCSASRPTRRNWRRQLSYPPPAAPEPP